MVSAKDRSQAVYTTGRSIRISKQHRVVPRPNALICLYILILCLCSLMGAQSAYAETTGDRIAGAPKDLGDWVPAMLSRESYSVEPGDTLYVNVQGKANLNYHAREISKTSEGTPPNLDEVVVTQDGNIFLPLIGKVVVAGKTVSEIETLVRTGLSKYIKQFEVSVSVSKVRTVNVWISGEAGNPGPLTMAAISTVSLAALQAGIKPTGTTRRLTLVRNGTKKIVDLYKMIVTGDASDDIPLKPGDSVHIPPVTKFVDVNGEVMRPGRYEMVTFAGSTDTFRVRDLLELSSGALPSAATDRCFVERIGVDGKKIAINVDLREQNGADTVLQSGDVLVVPSISAFQPMIWLIGEFKGDGVYQRTPGFTKEDVQNKSGIYFLKKGQTVLDVITATGGITPQADLKRARIERMESGSVKAIPVDLDRLLVADDKTADIPLQSGDSLVLPAMSDKVHVFGQIKTPGSYTYSPNRRLVDYLGDAGGPTPMAKLTNISVVRGGATAPNLSRLNISRAIEHGSDVDNPVLEPGDIVYIPAKFISDWRDVVQLVFTALSLHSLVK